MPPSRAAQACCTAPLHGALGAESTPFWHVTHAKSKSDLSGAVAISTGCLFWRGCSGCIHFTCLALRRYGPFRGGLDRVRKGALIAVSGGRLSLLCTERSGCGAQQNCLAVCTAHLPWSHLLDPAPASRHRPPSIQCRRRITKLLPFAGRKSTTYALGGLKPSTSFTCPLRETPLSLLQAARAPPMPWRPGASHVQLAVVE